MYQPSDVAPYTADSEVIDWRHPAVVKQAQQLRDGAADGEFGVVRRCFEWVSNRIPHSIDCKADSVPCTASEVLLEGHGLCYAKSHLFAALLRANGIPAGFDYQRLADERWGHVLHGLNTVFLRGHGWLQLDPRGVPESVTRLPAPQEQRVFTTSAPGELNYRLNLPSPLPEVVRVLQRGQSLAEVVPKLPGSVAMG